MQETGYLGTLAGIILGGLAGMIAGQIPVMVVTGLALGAALDTWLQRTRES